MASIVIKGAGIFRRMNEDRDVRATLNQMGSAIADYAVQNSIEFTDELGPQIARRISIEATKSLRGLLPFVSQKLFGQRSGATDFTLTAFHFGIRGEANSFGLASRNSVSVTWSALQRKYLENKQKRANPTYFKLTGELQRLFLHRASGEEFANKLGGIHASYVPSKQLDVNLGAHRSGTIDAIERRMGTIEVSLTPSRRISPGRFMGSLQEGVVSNDRDFFNPQAAKGLDQSLLGDWPNNTVEKLINKGRSGRRGGRFTGRAYRPVMQPTIAVWLLQRIPQSIQKTLSRFRDL